MNNKNNHYFESDNTISKKKTTENKKDFHKSFWTMMLALLLIIIGSFVCSIAIFPYKFRNYAYSILMILYVFVTILGFVLRITLDKKNLYLARGFMWGAIIMISLPAILLSLAFGACIIFINR